MFSRDFDDQVNQLDKVLMWLGSAGLKFKVSRCALLHECLPEVHPVEGANPIRSGEYGQDPELASVQDGA